jgi:NADH:ubiquinone reductase (H+-translocating)
MKIVVVGGGFGGVKTALELANKPNIEVTLVSNGTNFEYHGALYRTSTGRSPLEVALPLREIFAHAHNVSVVLDHIIDIHTDKKCIIGQDGDVYLYDSVVLALGSETNYFGLKGMEQHSFTLNTVAHTIALRQELSKQLKTHASARVAIVGAGPTGVELAGEVSHFATMIAERYSKPKCRVDVTLIDGADRVLPQLMQKASSKAHKRLTALDVRVLLNTRLDSCKEGMLCLSSGSLPADLIVWTAGAQLPLLFTQRSDIFHVEHGKVRVDQFLHPIGHESVYVIGDNALTPYSGMAQTALHDAKFVAKNILRLQQQQPLKWYRAVRPIYAVPIGPKWAILQTGRHVLSGRRAWAVRRRADLMIFRNFEPYRLAVKTWRKANRLAEF